MAKLPKPLAATLETATPKGLAKLSKSCIEAATKFKETGVLLEEAGKAFNNNDPKTALELLRHSQDRLNRKD